MLSSGNSGRNRCSGGGVEEVRGGAGGETHTEPVEEEGAAAGGGTGECEGLPVAEEEATYTASTHAMQGRR